MRTVDQPCTNRTEGSRRAIEEIHQQTPLAGFIYEPLVQGAAAMKMHDAESLNEILKLCKQHDIVLVADEVMTGFGKTGKNFASYYIETKPDIVCMSKALTAGLLPMGATSCTQKVFDAFYDEDIAKGLFHGHTYTANPLACTAALAGVELLTSEEMQKNIKRIEASHLAFQEKVKNYKLVKNTRCIGTIFALDLAVENSRYGNLRDKIYNFFMNQGVYLRPLGNTIYIACPYVITAEELNRIYEVILLLLENINDSTTRLLANTEREVLKILEGDCDTAIGAFSNIEGNNINLSAELFSVDGKQKYFVNKKKDINLAKELGREVGEILKLKSEGSYKR